MYFYLYPRLIVVVFGIYEQYGDYTTRRIVKDVHHLDDSPVLWTDYDRNNDELDYMDVGEVQQKADPIIISPTIPFLDESEDEISEKESNLFEMLSNNPENPQLLVKG